MNEMKWSERLFNAFRLRLPQVCERVLRNAVHLASPRTTTTWCCSARDTRAARSTSGSS